MNLLRPKNLEERIIGLLARGSAKTTDLLAALRGHGGTSPTKAGFYLALRKLKAEDMVVVYKGTAALNQTWLKQMSELIGRSMDAYGAGESDILALRDKESVSYHFATLQQLDNFWGHLQDIVVRATPANEPIYTYDPHYWFYIARPDIEKAHIALANSLGKQFLMTVEGSTPLDRSVLPDFDNEMRQYHMQKVFDKPGYYVVVVGDFIFEARFDQKTEEHINALYLRHQAPTLMAVQEMEQVPHIATRTRLKVSRNSMRARKIKAKLSKNFALTHRAQKS
jgi:hypothetical protein